ncbi:modification methylase [Corynebacterium xerosis]|uniref:adenine-specific methyltransferase EcoRI family protein n=1 Tax=Corynebacterium xerosis TaxID=1725 RepID=UPI000EAB946C|nr:adenine-specific methyltransferase EcoRI family protein [Corynebacterium xerosis]AYJ33016.1 modification methylase [Corynebacterium xerosis]
MAGNKTLSARNRNSKDEWYTQLVDIEKEIRHYRGQFDGKIVFCSCDDPYESNFFKYFAMNFNHLGLKKLIATSYAGSPIVGEQLDLLDSAGLKEIKPKPRAFKVEITEVPDLNDDGAIDLLDVEHLLHNDANTMSPLNGDGDFRSEESLALLDECDIVVTNPPFSLAREFLNLLIDAGKQFLVLGDQNHAKYSSVFPHIVENRLWFGYENGGEKWFRVPDDYEIKTESRKKIVDGVKYHSMGRIYWYTNLETTKRHESLTLYKRYSAAEYPTYTNYPAIEVGKVAEIPMDYDGEMGVPITFLDKYNPAQFKIVGISTQLAEPMSKYAAREDYATEAGKLVGGTGKFFFPKGGGKHQGVYERIVIKRIGAAS